MPINFNLNNFLKDKTMRILFTLIVLIIVATIIYLSLNGKHNKLPLNIETNIPEQKHIINERNDIKIGTVEGDVLTDSATKNVYK